MNKLFIFAIGGSGERVLRSLTMLMAAGVPGFEKFDKVFPIIIDYDQDNGDKDICRNCIETYQHIHNLGFSKEENAENEFFNAKVLQLQGLDHFTLKYGPNANSSKFKDYIDYGDLNQSTSRTRMLLDSLYDNSMKPTTELNLDLKVGFKGNPNIGSVVFNGIQNTEEFSTFLAQYNDGDRIVVVGSLFGGTGASGIPEIVKAIRLNKPTACIATVMVLPYFTLKKKDEGAINANLFYSKTKAALNYYSSSNTFEQINSIYFIGDPNPTVFEYCEGGQDQKNLAHIVEMVSAMAIVNFINNNNAAKSKNKQYKYSLRKGLSPNVKASANNASADAKDKQKTQFYYEDFDKDTKRLVLNYIVRLALAMDYFQNTLKNNRSSLTKQSYYTVLHLNEIKDFDSLSTNGSNPLQDLCFYLGEFHDMLFKWLKEMDNDKHNHRLTLINEGKLKDFVAKSNANTEVKEKTNIISDFVGALVNKPSVLVAKDISALLNNYITTDRFMQGKDLKSDVYKPFAFMDIMRSTTGDESITKKLNLQ